MSTESLRQEFEKPPVVPVKVRREGFLLGAPPARGELTGHIVKASLVRKFFRGGALLCYSPDGFQARNGTLCQDCLHPSCRPQLRVHLLAERVLYLLDLAGRSAQNLLALQDEVEREGGELVDWIVGLRVFDTGGWAEVLLERLARPGGAP